MIMMKITLGFIDISSFYINNKYFPIIKVLKIGLLINNIQPLSDRMSATGKYNLKKGVYLCT